MLPLVTVDLFSALVDSRTGGSAVLAGLAAERSWLLTGEQLYDAWDAANKEQHRRCTTWVPFRELAAAALGEVYGHHRLAGDPTADADALLASVGDWPLWDDSADGLAALATVARVGVLSNVDDDVFARTRVAALVHPDAVLTSERLRAYKPAPRIYRAAAERAGPGYVHVASSARDVRGALEAGIRTVRLRRPGHQVDPAGPQPDSEVDRLADVAARISA
ncbi:HAD family hydrolase [Blastococcus sp. SYSU D00820]